MMALARAGKIPPVPIIERPLAAAQASLDDLRARQDRRPRGAGAVELQTAILRRSASSFATNSFRSARRAL